MPFGLIWHNLRRHWLRTALTIGSLSIALFLVTALRALVLSLDAGVRGAAANRIVTGAAVSLWVQLPISYQPKIAAIEGIEKTIKWQWFGGYYQDPADLFAQWAVDKAELFDVYPELKLVSGSREEFLERRDACIVGTELAETYGWKQGDTIPLLGNTYPRNDGGAWEFYCAGVYEARMPVDNRTLFFDYEYLEKAGERGETMYWPGCMLFVARTQPGADQAAVIQAIDALYENGPIKTKTQPESEFNRQFVSMVGNIPALMAAIGGAVTFAIVMAALNTMLMASRERTRDLGVMKALGFTDATAFTLLLGESLIVSALGGVCGVGVALASEQGIAAFLSAQLFPGYQITRSMVATGLAAALAIGLIAGIVPAWRAARLRTIQAMRAEG
jgi:putative ABC transport system permease protein